MDPVALRARATLLRALRGVLASRGFLEVPTPCVVPSPALEETLHAWPVANGWLRTSPEMALKRALAAGLPRVYELGPAFRREEHGPHHRGEFLMLEWYRAGGDLRDLEADVEALVTAGATALGRPEPGPWRRTTVRALFGAACGVDPATAEVAELSERDPDWDAAFFRRWVEDVEPTVQRPTFVHGWPAAHAALATVRTDGAWPVAERFEAFLGGQELANAFQEYGDPEGLRDRWQRANAARAAQGAPPHPLDEAFLDAVGRMPRAAGIALGVDRLLAALMGWADIHRAQVGPGAR